MLFLHIGMPKTGTTSIQKVLAANEEALARIGLAYPDDWRNAEGLAHHAIGTAFASGDEDTIDRFVEQMSSVAAHRDVLVSSEAMINALGPKPFPAFADALSKLHKSVGVEVIVYLRRLDSFYESMYLHSTKTGEIDMEFDHYLDSRERWAETLFTQIAKLRYESPVNLRIKIFEQQRDIFREFLLSLGRQTDIVDLSAARDNVKLGLRLQTALLRFERINSAENFDSLERFGIFRSISNGDFKFEDDIYRYTILDPERQKCIVEHSLECAASVGIHEYETYRTLEFAPKPVHALDFDLLSPEDIDRFRRFCNDSRLARAS